MWQKILYTLIIGSVFLSCKENVKKMILSELVEKIVIILRRQMELLLYQLGLIYVGNVLKLKKLKFCNCMKNVFVNYLKMEVIIREFG